jgi:hypothetical protein
VIGGLQGETYATASSRAYPVTAGHGGYNNPDLVNIGVTDLTDLATGVVIPTGSLVARLAGAIANIGLSRDLTGLQLSGYQVTSPPAPSVYTADVTPPGGGVLMFENIDQQTIMVSAGITSLVNVATSPYVDDTIYHQRIRNVAIDHFIQSQITSQAQGDIGALLNTPTGRTSFIADIIAFLKGLEAQGVLVDGSSSAAVDPSRVSAGTALFLVLGILYQECVTQFYLSVAVGSS